MTIGIDLMGGDEDPILLMQELIPQFESTFSDEFEFVLFLDEKTALSHHPSKRIRHVIAQETITMEDSPLFAARRKKNSSLSLGITHVKEKKIDALVTTGNTGALVASACMQLPLFERIDRPVLLALLPTEKGTVAVLDVGANVTMSPTQMVQCAQMGVAFCQCYHGIASPKVALLNIGREESKGRVEVKESFQKLQEYFRDHEGLFLGNIEGKEVFQGEVDVLITDGFTGNVFLKTCEGASSFLLEYLKKNLFNGGEKLFNYLFNKFDYAAHPGALLCGVEGVVIKCHGHSDSRAIMSGINGAIEVIKRQVIPYLQKNKN